MDEEQRRKRIKPIGSWNIVVIETLILTAFWMFLKSPNAFAQEGSGTNLHGDPDGCALITSGYGPGYGESGLAEDRNYDADFKEFDRLWCKGAVSSLGTRVDAADRLAEAWKALWYRRNPFNAAFHETGSYEMLVHVAITHMVPEPMIEDRAFMSDWLKDCRLSCFLIYGDDDPSAPTERAKMLRLRDEVIQDLHGPASRPVVTMLKTAKLY